jgi:hypothetical protein
MVIDNETIRNIAAGPLGADPVIAKLAYQRAGEALEVIK